MGEDGKKNVFWYGFCQGIDNLFGGISRAKIGGSVGAGGAIAYDILLPDWLF